MVTKPIALAVWSRLVAAPSEWLNSKEGMALVEKSVCLQRRSRRP